MNDASAERDAGADADWDFENGSSGMSKETKIGLLLIVILLSAFAFVVYKKLERNGRLDDSSEVAKKTIAPTEDDGGDEPQAGQSGGDEHGSAPRDPFGEDPETPQQLAQRPPQQQSFGDDGWGALDSGSAPAQHTADDRPQQTGQGNEPAPWDPAGASGDPEQLTRVAQQNEPAAAQDGFDFAGGQSEPVDASPSNGSDPWETTGRTAQAEPQDFSSPIDFGGEPEPLDGEPSGAVPAVDVATAETGGDPFGDPPANEQVGAVEPGAQQPASGGDGFDAFTPVDGEPAGASGIDPAAQLDPAGGNDWDEAEAATGVSDAGGTTADPWDSPWDGGTQQQANSDPSDTRITAQGSTHEFTREPAPDTGDPWDDGFQQPQSTATVQAGAADPAGDTQFEFSREPAPIAAGGFGQTASAGPHPLDDGSTYRLPDGRRPAVHVVRPGESYWSITRRHYGTAKYYRAVERFNSRRIPDPKKMRPGMKVVLPRAEELERLYPDLLPRTGRTSQTVAYAGGPVLADDALPDRGLFFDRHGTPHYRIGRADTLTEIAHRHLGRGSRWVQIFQMNRDTLTTPQNLKVGTVLRLPADASRVQLVGNPQELR